MARYSKKSQISTQTKDEAMKIARGTQKPGQTKEQTKLIAQGIQKGIDLYKKQQKSKARELDRKIKKVSSAGLDSAQPDSEQVDDASTRTTSIFPWLLLILSWIGFGLYLFAVR